MRAYGGRFAQTGNVAALSIRRSRKLARTEPSSRRGSTARASDRGAPRVVRPPSFADRTPKRAESQCEGEKRTGLCVHVPQCRTDGSFSNEGACCLPTCELKKTGIRPRTRVSMPRRVQIRFCWTFAHEAERIILAIEVFAFPGMPQLLRQSPHSQKRSGDIPAPVVRQIRYRARALARDTRVQRESPQGCSRRDASRSP